MNIASLQVGPSKECNAVLMILCLGLVDQTERNSSATHNQELVKAIVHLVDLLDIVFVYSFVDSIAEWLDWYPSWRNS
jgi:hypothetical protein